MNGERLKALKIQSILGQTIAGVARWKEKKSRYKPQAEKGTRVMGGLN